MPMKKSGLFRNKNAKATPYKNKGVTEVGKEAKTHSYKEYVQKMFGGGMMSPQPFTAQKPTGAARTDPPRPMPPRRPIPGSTGTLGDRALNFGKPRTQLIDPILPRGKVGKEAKTQSYKEYVQKMFGGGMTQTKMNRGGLTLDPLARKKSFMDSKDSSLRNVGTQAEQDLGLRIHRGPGMKAGGKTKKMGTGGMFGSGPTKPKNPSTPGSWGDKINKIRNRNPDPILPRGKKGKGDI